MTSQFLCIANKNCHFGVYRCNLNHKVFISPLIWSGEVFTSDVCLSALGPLFARLPSFVVSTIISSANLCSSILPHNKWKGEVGSAAHAVEPAPESNAAPQIGSRQTFVADTKWNNSHPIRRTCYNPTLLSGKRRQRDWWRLRTVHAPVGS